MSANLRLSPFRRAIIVLLVLLLLAAGLLWLLNPVSEDPGGTGITSLPVADYLAENDVPQIREWLDICGASLDLDSASALVYRSRDRDLFLTQYLVYLPAAPDLPQLSISRDRRLFSESISIGVSAFPGTGTGNTLLLITHTCDRRRSPDLELSCNGQTVKCRFLEADFSLGLTDGAER